MAETRPPRANVGVLDHFEVAGFSWLGPDSGVDRIIISVDGVELAAIPAHTYRPALQKVGIGDGRCAFRFRFAGTQESVQPGEGGVRAGWVTQVGTGEPSAISRKRSSLSRKVACASI